MNDIKFDLSCQGMNVTDEEELERLLDAISRHPDQTPSRYFYFVIGCYAQKGWELNFVKNQLLKVQGLYDVTLLAESSITTKPKCGLSFYSQNAFAL